jgi:two-component sensor histidine kinase
VRSHPLSATRRHRAWLLPCREQGGKQTERVLKLLLTTAKQGPLFRYGAMLGMVAASFLARNGLDVVLPGYTFILFYPSVFAIAVLLGSGPGLVSVGLHGFLAAFHWLEPLDSFWAGDPHQLVALVIFTVSSLVAVGLTEVLHQALARVAAAEQEKDLLMRELHHRIGNDLQGIAAILQRANRPGADLTDLIARSRTRIGILGSVYARLRRDRERAEVSSRDYIEDLIADLRAVSAAMRSIGVRASVDDMPLGIGCAVSIGIMINELVTNALKYAFPGNRPGLIQVDFHRHGEDAVLSVRDDGVGLASTTAPAGTGLGGALLRGLAANLGGTFSIRSGGGVEATIRFPVASCTA